LDNTNITEAIILAGGLGTRLQSVVSDVPKCMAPVNDVPFLEYVIQYAYKQGVRKFVLSVGYKKEFIEQYIKNRNFSFEISYCIENAPLGTGGAIAKSLLQCSTNNVLVLNGDTFFEYTLPSHINNSVACTIALKKMDQFDRYGAVTINSDNQIINFEEKKFVPTGLINTGVYIINKNSFFKNTYEEKFSFEKEYLEKYVGQSNFNALVQEGYFIDIGIPVDYEIAQSSLKHKIIKAHKNAALFLDRDGVINDESKKHYVTSVSEFEFLPGVLEAIARFTTIFNKIFIATNQRVVGKQIISEIELEAIHNFMLQHIERNGGKIHKIYYATAVDDADMLRKPNTGMALQAQDDFDAIDLKHCIMIGNSMSDMEFGRNAGMQTIFVASTKPRPEMPNVLIDFYFNNLLDVANYMQQFYL
jgi:D-glycero-alpha-D-manno-heptose 1-phosphate guanylyltransferase